MQAAEPGSRAAAGIGLDGRRGDVRLAIGADAFCYLVRHLHVRWVAAALVERSPFLQPFAGLPLHLTSGWDSQYYRENFARYQHLAWPPLYSATLRLVAWGLRFEGDAFAKAALLLNLLCHVAIAYLVVRLVAWERAAEGQPAPALERWLAPVLVLSWPLHNAFHAAYSESLFLALAIACLLAYRQERFAAAALLVALAFLTRTMGIFLVAGLLADALYQGWRGGRGGPERRRQAARLLPGLAGIACIVGWNLYLRLAHGVDLEALQRPWIEELTRVHVPPGMEPRLWVAGQLLLLRLPDALATWAALAVLVVSVRRERAFDAGFVGTFLGSFALHVYRPFSVPRLLSVVFPISLQLARWSSRGSWLAVLAAVVFSAAALVGETLLFAGRAGEP
jgi:hypothetical protein